MFTFFRGDRTFFRQNTTVVSYTATTNVTPLFEFSIYLENGTFVETSKSVPSQYYAQAYVPFFNPNYAQYAEDTVLEINGRNMYRVMRAFTPSLTVVDWTGTQVVNTSRIQEYAGNLLRYVREYTCDEDILPQLGRVTSATKLGVADITLITKSTGQLTNAFPRSKFVWENTTSFNEVPQLSWFTGTTYEYSPPNYDGGTLNL